MPRCISSRRYVTRYNQIAARTALQQTSSYVKTEPSTPDKGNIRDGSSPDRAITVDDENGCPVLGDLSQNRINTASRTTLNTKGEMPATPARKIKAPSPSSSGPSTWATVAGGDLSTLGTPEEDRRAVFIQFTSSPVTPVNVSPDLPAPPSKSTEWTTFRARSDGTERRESVDTVRKTVPLVIRTRPGINVEGTVEETARAATRTRRSANTSASLVRKRSAPDSDLEDGTDTRTVTELSPPRVRKDRTAKRTRTRAPSVYRAVRMIPINHSSHPSYTGPVLPSSPFSPTATPPSIPQQPDKLLQLK